METYLAREVFLNEVEGGLVHHFILMGLQGLDFIQATAFFNHQTQLISLTDLVSSLKHKVTLRLCHQINRSCGVGWGQTRVELTRKILLIASKMTRIVLLSLTDSKFSSGSKTLACTRYTTCSMVPPLVKLVTAHTASFWVL